MDWTVVTDPNSPLVRVVVVGALIAVLVLLIRWWRDLHRRD